MPIDTPVPILHLICGLPGAGKTTLARKLEHELGAVRFSPDEWLSQLGADLHDEALRAKVEALQWHIAQRLLVLGNVVVLENGFWSRAERESYRTGAVRLGVQVKLHFLNVPLSELKQRVSRRNASAERSAARINPADLDRWSLLFERPGEDELC